jgi:hypothetical protein
VTTYAVGFARPDHWSPGQPTAHAFPWHAVEAQRSPADLDGDVLVAVCGAVVQVWGSQKWARTGAGRTACPECARISGVVPVPPPQPLTQPPTLACGR